MSVPTKANLEAERKEGLKYRATMAAVAAVIEEHRRYFKYHMLARRICILDGAPCEYCTKKARIEVYGPEEDWWPTKEGTS